MEIPKYIAREDEENGYKQLYSFMPNDTFRMLMSGPSGCGKTNTLIHMLVHPLLMYDCIYLYSKNLHQSLYRDLQLKLNKMSHKVGYPILESSNDVEEIIPLRAMDPDSQKIVIFDDLLTEKNQNQIIEYFIGGRHKNCSCIYITQSFFDTKKPIRINCTHHVIYEPPTSRERSTICRELGIPVDKFKQATEKPYNFAYVDRVSKKLFRNFTEEVK